MNLFINLFALIANLVAFFAIYHSFGKKMVKENKIKITLIIIGAMYLITLVIYFLSGIGIEKVSNSVALRNYLMMAFVPINLIVIIPFSIYSFMQTQNKKIDKQILNKRLLIVEIVAIVILIVEFFYFRNVQKNNKRLADEAQNLANNKEVVVNIEDSNIEENNTENNNIKNNNIENDNNTENNNIIS